MTLAERYQWAYGVAALVTSGVYFGWLALQVAAGPVDEIDYVRALLWTLLASFLVHAVGRGLVRGHPASEERRDERDRDVDLRADALSFYVFSALAAVPLVLGLAGVDPFWTTNALFAAFSLTAVLGVVSRATLYRTGPR